MMATRPLLIYATGQRDLSPCLETYYSVEFLAVSDNTCSHRTGVGSARDKGMLYTPGLYADPAVSE